jgi:hypothetical protein
VNRLLRARCASRRSTRGRRRGFDDRTPQIKPARPQLIRAQKGTLLTEGMRSGDCNTIYSIDGCVLT